MKLTTLSFSEIVRDRFLLVNRLHHAALERNMSAHGLHRSQFFMLHHLHRSQKACSQKELAEAFEISPAAVTVMLKKLEKQGYVTREPSDTDSRRNDIQLTEKARELLDTHHRLAHGVDEMMFYGFTDEELQHLSNCLTKMYENLRGLQEGRLTVPPSPAFGSPRNDAFSDRKDDRN